MPAPTPSESGRLGGFVLALSLWAQAASGQGLLEPRPQKPDGWSESFNLMADLEDGSYVWAQLSFTNLGPGSANAGCRLLVSTPGQPTVAASAGIRNTRYRYAPASGAAPEWLEVGNGQCRLEGGAKPRLRVSLSGKTVELRYLTAFLAQAPPGTKLSLKEGYYQSEVFLPWGQVEARLSEGGPTLRGGGYVDHGTTTLSPRQLPGRWLRFRAVREGPHFLVLAREAPDGSFSPAYQWRQGQPPQLLTSFQLSRTGPTQSPRFRAELPGLGSLSTTAPIHRSAPVEELGLMGRLVRPMLGSPITYIQRATLETDGGSFLSGVLEVSVPEE